MKTRGTTITAGQGVATPSGKTYTDARDQIDEAKVRLAFLYESAPVTYIGHEFSRAGLDGLGYALCDIAANLEAASKIIKTLAKKERIRII